MAIFPEAAADGNAPAPVDIDAWTEQATEAMRQVSISAAATMRGTTISLNIPLDDHPETRTEQTSAGGNPTVQGASTTYVRRREPIRRDSLKRREALLKGKEGSRRRQRWENDRLLGNPYVQQPLPSDWEVRPTYHVKAVPYYLAPLWDVKYAAKEQQRTSAKPKPKSPEAEAYQRVPKELRERLKRSRAAKGLLIDLEEEVRRFVKNWEEKEQRREKDGLIDPDSEDEEIVFVGRNGQMNDMPSPRTSYEQAERDKLLFDSPADDHGASFGRWLVHSLAAYYDLRSWSVTVGKPARREAYVGIKDNKMRSGHRLPIDVALPRPLYGLV